MSSNYQEPDRVPAIGFLREILLNNDLYFSELYLALGYLYKHIPSNETYRLIEVVDENLLVMQNVLTTKIEIILAKHISNIDMLLDSRGGGDTDCIGDSAWTDMQNRYHAVIVCRGRHNVNNSRERQNPDHLPVDAITLEKWEQAFNSVLMVTGLLDRNPTYSDKCLYMNDIAFRYSASLLSETYLSSKRLSVEKSVREIQKACHKRKLYPMDSRAIRKLITDIPAIKVMSSRGLKGEVSKLPQYPEVIPSATHDFENKTFYKEIF